MGIHLYGGGYLFLWVVAVTVNTNKSACTVLPLTVLVKYVRTLKVEL